MYSTVYNTEIINSHVSHVKWYTRILKYVLYFNFKLISERAQKQMKASIHLLLFSRAAKEWAQRAAGGPGVVARRRG